MRCVSWGSLAKPLFTTNTTTMLWQRILCPAQLEPHTATAMTMRTISLGAMGIDSHVAGHAIWKQWPFQVAPHPQEPDASEYMAYKGSMAGRKEILFRDCMNVCHHTIYVLAPANRWTWWSSDFAVDVASIRVLSDHVEMSDYRGCMVV